MTIRHHRVVLMCMAIVGFCTAHASAVTLFSDNFNTNTSGSWTTNAAPAANAATQMAQFAFDYAPFGIPPAPGTADTLGLRLRANIPIVGGNEVTSRPAGVLSGLSLSPTGQDFGTNYIMTFYAWSNFFGAPNTSGLADNANSEGGTANVMFALGTSGTVPLVAGNPNIIPSSTMDGIGFATTGDGGIGSDYRAFLKSSTPATAASGVYAAGTANDAGGNSPLSNFNTFYTTLPSLAAHTAPVEQQALSTAEYGSDAMNTQLGSTQAGSFGFAWHKVVIKKNNNTVSWDVDETRIATVDASAIIMGGNNIALGVSDVNTSTARHPSLVFTVFDNLVVTDVPPDGLLGDFDNNGTVNAGDYVIWRKNDGTSNALANDNGLGTPIGAAHYNLWRANFGKPPGAGSATLSTSVPEPGSLLLLSFGAGCYWCRQTQIRKARAVGYW